MAVAVYRVETPGMDADEWVSLYETPDRTDAYREARRRSRDYHHDPVRVAKRRMVAIFWRGRRVGGRPDKRAHDLRDAHG